MLHCNLHTLAQDPISCSRAHMAGVQAHSCPCAALRREGATLDGGIGLAHHCTARAQEIII